ncbi:MORN repeat-containing protein [Roseibium sp.]|uniref:MORN repeat-containing protein n=1 Tax=Roseibium sp. TaxID=1936156 RepID=UPI003BAA8470
MRKRLIFSARTLALFTPLLAAGIAEAQAEDYWAADPVTGCQIWSDTPVDTAIATWSDACVDGKASGTGSLVWLEGGQLVGTYRGSMAGGKLNGPGVLQVKAEDGSGFDQIETIFADGEPTGPGAALAANGDRFQGTFKGGAKDGFGVLTDADGNFYEGTFKDGQPHGFGYLKGIDGETYLGELAAGAFEGEGLLLHANGEFYAGGFKVGLAEGVGRYEDLSGGIYAGQFSGGKPNGVGNYLTVDGTAIQGRFVDQKPDGMVLITAPDGTQTVETWQNGEKVQ